MQAILTTTTFRDEEGGQKGEWFKNQQERMLQLQRRAHTLVTAEHKSGSQKQYVEWLRKKRERERREGGKMAIDTRIILRMSVHRLLRVHFHWQSPVEAMRLHKHSLLGIIFSDWVQQCSIKLNPIYTSLITVQLCCRGYSTV